MTRRIAYQVIFGKTFGSGHLRRAQGFRANVRDNVDIHVITESKSDTFYIKKYKIDCLYSPVFNAKNYDLVVDDTLGLHSDKIGNANKIWFIDALYRKMRFDLEELCGSQRYSILYPETGSPFPYPEIFYDQLRPCAALFQGGGDDHIQLVRLMDAIPLEHDIIIGVGSNCRFLPDLKASVNRRGNAVVLIDFDVRRIAGMSDYVVTAGGNILSILMSMQNLKAVVLYSCEEKEHMTFKLYQSDKRVVKIFNFGEAFSYDACLLPDFKEKEFADMHSKFESIIS
jgi:hypothetical protein